jgi:polyisoprenoid-binding protein YceI
MASISTPASLTTWKIDPAHTVAEFKVKHMMIANVKGTIKGITGDLTEHSTDASLSFIEAALDVSTLNTGEHQRDSHLKSPDFLDLEKYPAITFKSTQVERKGQDEYAMTGDLTIHGVTGLSRSPLKAQRRRRRILGEMSALVWRPRPRSTAKTSVSPGTPRSKPEESWSATRCK